MPVKSVSSGRVARRWSSAVGVLCLLAAACVARGESLTYSLRPQPNAGTLHVQLIWKTAGRSASVLRVSRRWGTLDDVPGVIRNLRIDGAKSVRTKSPGWIISHATGATLSVEYDVDPRRREFDWNSTHHPITTKQFFHGMGNAFLLAPEPTNGAPQEYEVVLRWELPQGWKAACSWGPGRVVGAQLKVSDLRHSVYLAGRLATKKMERNGRTVSVAMVDDFKFSVGAFTKMAADIIDQQCRFMNDDDFPRFVVTAVPVGEPVIGQGATRLSGVGLYNSFAMFVSPKSDLTDAVEHLFAHELFHFWNGRLLAGRDPEELVYWFTEGLTDYYALRILYESGHWPAERYVKWINRHIQEYHRNPAIHATNKQIKQRYWSDRGTYGEVAYQRGLLLGLRWHRLARNEGVGNGIDRLFLTLVRRASESEFELTNGVIRQMGASLLGAWFGPEFDRYVERAETIELPLDALDSKFVGRSKPVYAYELGFNRNRSLKERKVRRLKRGSAAQKAGLREGDELAGWNIFGDPNKKTVLQVRRGGKIKKISYYPRGKRMDVIQFRPLRGSKGPSP